VKQGRAHPGLAAAHQWLLGLERAQQEQIERLAMAEIDTLARQLDEIVDSAEPDDPTWLWALTDLCERRDEVEAVRVLLGTAACRDSLDEQVHAFDTWASDAVEPFLSTVFLESEKLARAAVVDPDAWWVCLLRDAD
jgi:hypothetical protein